MKDEERDMWNQLLVDIKRAKTINIRCAEVSKLIVALESSMNKGTLQVSLRFMSVLGGYHEHCLVIVAAFR